MKILYVNPAGILGGAERCLLDVMASLRRGAPSLRLALLALEPGPLVDRAASLGVETHVLPMPAALASLGDSGLRDQRSLGRLRALAGAARHAALPAAGYLRALRAEVRSLAPDLVHSNGMKSHLLLPFATPRRVPLVWHVRDFVGERPVMARALGTLAPLASAAIGISQAVTRDAAAAFGRLPVHHVYDAIDTEEFRPPPGPATGLDALAGMAPAPPDAVRVGLIATYARWKGHDLFLDAASRFVARRPSAPVRFYVIGGPIYATRASQFSEAELRERVERLGITERVGFVPFQPEPRGVYLALDVAVHASTRPEPFGRTIVEAMACGRATIVSRAGGAAELFADGVDALGVAPGDAEALSRAIERLVNDAPLRQRLGAAGRDAAVARFSRERLAGELEALYRRLAADPRARREKD